MKKLLIIFVMLLCLCCCNKNKQNNKITVVHLKSESVKLNNDYIGKGGFLTAYANGIIGLEESQSMPAFYRISKEAENISILRFGNRGQGPTDFIYPLSVQYLDENTFGVHDVMKKAFFEISVWNNKDSVEIINQQQIEPRGYRVVKTAYNQYLILSANKGLFTLADSIGKEISSFFEYPYKDEDEHKIPNQMRSMAYQGCLKTNPSRTKCVYASMDGEIIHFYDIQKNKVSLIRKIEKEYPNYKPDERNDSRSIIADKTNMVGYISLSATDRYVYALFCGQRLEILKNEDPLVGSQVIVFNWNGDVVKEYILDTKCRYIGVSNDDSCMWAIALTPDTKLVTFDLTANNEKQSQSINIVKPDINIKTTESIKEPIVRNGGESLKIKGRQISFGEMLVGEKDSLIVIIKGKEIYSSKVTSNDITVKFEKPSSMLEGNVKGSFMYLYVTKKRKGIFNDTITAFTKDNQTEQFFVVGEVK